MANGDLLIGQIQDAAFDESLLSIAIQSICEAFCGSFASIQEDIAGSTYGRLYYHADIHAAAAKEYEIHYSKKSLTGQDRLRYGVGEIYTEYMYQNQAELLKSETYNDFFLKHKMGHLVHSFLERNSYNQLGFVIRRDQMQGPFNAEDLTRLKIILPHIRQTMRVNARLHKAANHANGLEALLNRLTLGAAVLDGLGRIRFANQAAERILTAQDGLTRNRAGRLQAWHAADQLRLEAVVGGILRARPQFDQAVSIARPSGKPNYGLIFSPAPGDGPMQDERASALVFLQDPGLDFDTTQQILAELFGLTNAEARIVHALRRGRSPRSIAQLLNISENTVRTHMKSIFGKLEAKTQADVQRILAANIPHLEHRAINPQHSLQL